MPPEADFFPALQRKTFTIGNRQVHMETGRLARAASASVLLRCEDTVVMVNATGSETPRPGIDFFPLLIDFEEKMYSVGRLPGGYLKREGRPSDKAILAARLIDRPIRPLWPDGYRNDVQIVATPLSVDGVVPYDVLAIFGASMALELSGLPFQGPLGAVRVGCIEGEFVANPGFADMEQSTLDLVVAGTEDSIMMVEAGADFVPEDLLLRALAFAQEEIKRQVQVQREFAQQCGVEKKQFVFPHDLKPVEDFVKQHCHDDLFAAYHDFDRTKRQEAIAATKKKLKESLAALPDDNAVKSFLEEAELDYLSETFKKLEKRIMRDMIMNENVRADGRNPEQIRPIFCQVGILPRVHGSALFTRGNTQALSVATLGAPGDAQRLDGVDPATEKRWMHHYSFPGYSVGEVRPMRGAGRREVGHGALVERGISYTLPAQTDFPYTLRVNSDILESNGSTSMASMCGTSLALMDAGVPVKSAISGIAMGLIKEGDRYVILSDIQGVEDFLGDMDFKVAGNESGVTALQMDIKIQGISIEIMKSALEQAKRGRLHILEKMNAAISAPRENLSPWAPRIISLTIDTDMIGTVIGPGGKMIRSIIEQTGATIDIEDSGLVTITSVSGEGGEKARDIILKLTQKIDPGLITVGKVVRIIPIGAFVELAPGRDGMIHVSQLLHRRVEKVEDVLTVGDEVVVKVIDIDERGRISLTMKGVTNEERANFGFEPLPEPDPAFAGARSEGRGEPRGDRGDRGPRGPRGPRPERGPRQD
jgi:polyribonucleotide nucleotidyltransferase